MHAGKMVKGILGRDKGMLGKEDSMLGRGESQAGNHGRNLGTSDHRQEFNLFKFLSKGICVRDLPVRPVVKTWPSNEGGMYLNPGQGAPLPHASWPKKKAKYETEAVL